MPRDMTNPLNEDMGDSFDRRLLKIAELLQSSADARREALDNAQTRLADLKINSQVQPEVIAAIESIVAALESCF